ncbi:Uncharacterised protein [Mycobacteroides abscessus]|nr:Uncharacterised protein [Mycobacteroides abscessus]
MISVVERTSRVPSSAVTFSSVVSRGVLPSTTRT